MTDGALIGLSGAFGAVASNLITNWFANRKDAKTADVEEDKTSADLAKHLIEHYASALAKAQKEIHDQAKAIQAHTETIAELRVELGRAHTVIDSLSERVDGLLAHIKAHSAIVAPQVVVNAVGPIGAPSPETN